MATVANGTAAESVASRGWEPIELEIPIFAGGYGVRFYEETARQFEALRPDVRVNIYGDPRMHDKMRVRMIDGSFPDATFTELPWPNLIRAGKVVDLTPHLDGPSWEGSESWRETFLPGALDMWTFDGSTYGLPLAQSCWTVFYNKGLFLEHGWKLPRTWDEFFALCEEIKASGVAPVSLPGVYLRYGDGFIRAAYYNLVGPEGWRAYNDLAAGTRASPQLERAAGVFQRLTTQNLVAGWEGMTHTAAQLAFLQGRAAMVVSGSWFVNEMTGKFPEGFQLGAMNFPVFDDGIGDPTAVQGSSEYFFVFDNGDRRREQAAIDFLRFMTSRERATAFARENDSPVAVKGVPRTVFSERMQDTAGMFELARASYSAPHNMLMPAGLSQALTDARYDLATGTVSPRQFAERLELAAAASRDRSESDRHRVAVRHPVLAALLLAALAGAGVWTAVGVKRRLAVGRAGRRGSSRRQEAGIGRERRSFSLLTSAATGLDEPVRTPDAPATWFGRLRPGFAAVFVGPAFLLFAAVVLVPGTGAFIWSFSEWDSLNPREWVGFFNFRWLLFESDVFWQALGNNLFLMLVPAMVVVPLALLFAVLIHRGVLGANVFRACFLFPNILGGVAASLIWLAAYDPANGFINSALTEAGQWVGSMSGDTWMSRWLLGFENHAWLAKDRLFWALIPIYVWLMVGFNLVLYLAAMEGIDSQYYEAAELDGAGQVRQFFSITLPMIREVIVISVVFIVIGGLNTFEMVWLLTGQEPLINNHVLATWMVSTMFHDFEIGRATAIAVVMFVLVAAASAVALLGGRRDPVEA